MRTSNRILKNCIGLALVALSSAASAQQNFPNGLTLGSGSGRFLFPWNDSGENIEFSSYYGGMVLYSGQEGGARGVYDGGISLYGNPIDIILESPDDTAGNVDRGNFNVWRSSKYFGVSTAKPLFQISSPSEVATFEGVDVVINDGTLTIGGSPAVTVSSLGSYLASAGAINADNVGTYLSNNGYLKKANGSGAAVSNGALFALGELAEADQQGTVAIGDFTSASGYGSVALGNYSFTAVTAYEATAVGGGRANDDYALAMVYGNANGYASFATQGAQADGVTSIALGGLDFVYGDANHAEGDNSAAIGGVRNYSTGIASFASGNWNIANSAYSVALGSMNLAPTGNPNAWVETDSLFELGNGIAASSASPPASARSNAITTLKNGRTTLTNKAWLANTGQPLADPAAPNDSGGAALVVEGHTELKGKVIISEPQGDISMGIYE